MPVNKVRRRGSYAPLSAHYYKDDRLIRAGEKAELLYVRGLAFCADVLSDGFISDAQLAHVGVGLTAVKARAKALVEVGAWERAAGGYRVTAWLHWNKSRDDILDDNRKDADRKAPQASDQPLPPEPPPDSMPESDLWSDTDLGNLPFGIPPDSVRSPNGSGPHSEPSHAGPRAGTPEPEPTPEPTPEPPLATRGGSRGESCDDAPAAEAKTASRKRSARNDGHRIPEDWWPSDSDRDWFRENCPNLVGEGTPLTHEFVGYWKSKPGKDGRKLDWSLTWQTWMRRENRNHGNRYRGRPQTSDIVASGRDYVAAMEAEEAAAEGRLAPVHQLTRGA